MKKVFATLTALILIAFSSASCGRPDYTSGPPPTTVPMPVVDLSPVMGEHEEASQPSSPAETEKYADDKFEHLRAAALSAVPDDGTLESAVIRHLISCDSDAITLALPIRLPDMEGDLSGGTSRRYHVMEAAVCKYYAIDGILYESEVAFVPVLVKVKSESTVIESISVPDIEDYAQCEADIKDIFGVECEDELALWSGDEETDLSIKDEYSRKLSNLRYEIAVSGGYDEYPNIVTEILSSMLSAECPGKDTAEGAVCGYFIENSFAYKQICFPVWHEVGCEEIPELSNGRLIYAVLHMGIISSIDDGSIMTGSETCPALIDIKASDSGYTIDLCKKLTADSAEFENLFGIFADEYVSFCSSDEYDEMALDCDRITESLADGTFDFETDSLFSGKTGD